MQKVKCDLTQMNQQLIIAGLAGLITDDGLTFHQVMAVLEDIKRQCFPALMEISRDPKGVNDHE